jgi:FxsC-like protein
VSCYFFFSCSADDLDSDLTVFFEDLRKEVAHKIGSDEGATAYLMRQPGSVGTYWPDSAAKALAECKVFVPVYTSRFMSSTYCGREYYAFRQRLLQSGLDWDRIVPIWWNPPADGVPSAISNVVDARGLLHMEHQEHGLRLVFRNREDSHVLKVYNDILAELAAMIFERARDLPRLRSDVSFDLLRGPSIFDKAPDGAPPQTRQNGPLRVNFLVLSGTRAEMGAVSDRKVMDFYHDSRELWNPFHPESDRSLAFEACRIATNQRDEIFPNAYAAPSDLNLYIQQKEAEGEMVVILVDSWATYLNTLSTLLTQYDTRRFRNATMVVPFPGTDTETSQLVDQLRGRLYENIPRTMGSGPVSYREDAGTLEEFRIAITEVLHGLKHSIVMGGPPPRQLSTGSPQVMPVLTPPTGA